MFREFVYIVNDPDGDNVVFQNNITALKYVTNILMDMDEVLSAYLDDIRSIAQDDPNYVPESFSEFVNEIVINGDYTDYNCYINEYPILTEKDL